MGEREDASHGLAGEHAGEEHGERDCREVLGRERSRHRQGEESRRVRRAHDAPHPTGPKAARLEETGAGRELGGSTLGREFGGSLLDRGTWTSGDDGREEEGGGIAMRPDDDERLGAAGDRGSEGGAGTGTETGAGVGRAAGSGLDAGANLAGGGPASRAGPSKVRLRMGISGISPEIMPASVAAPSATVPRPGWSTTGRRAKARSMRARTAGTCAMPPVANTAWIRSGARPASSSARAESAETRSSSSSSIGSSCSRVSVISGPPGTNHAAALASVADERSCFNPSAILAEHLAEPVAGRHEHADLAPQVLRDRAIDAGAPHPVVAGGREDQDLRRSHDEHRGDDASPAHVDDRDDLLLRLLRGGERERRRGGVADHAIDAEAGAARRLLQRRGALRPEPGRGREHDGRRPPATLPLGEIDQAADQVRGRHLGRGPLVARPAEAPLDAEDGRLHGQRRVRRRGAPDPHGALVEADDGGDRGRPVGVAHERGPAVGHEGAASTRGAQIDAERNRPAAHGRPAYARAAPYGTGPPPARPLAPRAGGEPGARVRGGVRREGRAGGGGVGSLGSRAFCQKVGERPGKRRPVRPRGARHGAACAAAGPPSARGGSRPATSSPWPCA